MSRRSIKYYVLAALFISTIGIWYGVIREDRRGVLTVSFLDIGQGDALLIEAPNGNQIMVDGGAGPIALRALGKVLPFYDRTVDGLLVTNPDKDHMGGFIDVMHTYKVDYLFEPGTKSASNTYAALEATAQEAGVKKILVKRGMKIILDQKRGVYVLVLFPDRDVSTLATNDGSVVAKLIYGKTSFLLTGDSPIAIEKYLLQIDGPKILKSDVLKVGHHGSRTSTNLAYAAVVAPKYAVISNAKGNSYGHPHQETLDTLKEVEATVLRTDERGTIRITSNGREVHVE